MNATTLHQFSQRIVFQISYHRIHCVRTWKYDKIWIQRENSSFWRRFFFHSYFYVSTAENDIFITNGSHKLPFSLDQLREYNTSKTCAQRNLIIKTEFKIWYYRNKIDENIHNIYFALKNVLSYGSIKIFNIGRISIVILF